MADDGHGLDKVDPKLTRSIHSREIFTRLIEPRLMEQGYDAANVQAVLKGFIQALYGGKDKGGDDAAKTDKDRHPLARSEVIVLGEPEVEFLIAQAKTILDTDKNAEPKAIDNLVKGLLKNKEAKENFKALANGAGIDAAMFGRFVSGDPEARISSAVHVAHALTVHAEAAETDYFTAVDDLTTASEGGSGHLGAAELTSGLFYTYVVVDVPQLVSNMTGEPFEDWARSDRTVAARVVNHLIRLMATVSPGAKLGSTAPYDHAGLVLVEAGDRQPRTLANAYLDPLPLSGGNLFGRAVANLGEYIAAMDAMYDAEETRWLACRTPTADMAGFKACHVLTLPKLAEAVEAAVLKGELA